MSIDLKHCLTKSQLADQYSVSRKTMSNWLAKMGCIGIPFHGNLYTPGQIKQIYEKLDSPDFEKETDHEPLKHAK